MHVESVLGGGRRKRRPSLILTLGYSELAATSLVQLTKLSIPALFLLLSSLVD